MKISLVFINNRYLLLGWFQFIHVPEKSTLYPMVKIKMTDPLWEGGVDQHWLVFITELLAGFIRDNKAYCIH
jgi:hypothetical protein